jgi:hypothetical protein
VVMWHVLLGHDKQVESKKNKTNELVEKKLKRKNLPGTQMTTSIVWVHIVFVWHQVVVFVHLQCSCGCYGWWVQTESGWVWIESGVATRRCWWPWESSGRWCHHFFLGASMTKWSMHCHRIYKHPQNNLLYLPSFPILVWIQVR